MTLQQPPMSINKILHSDGTDTNSDDGRKGIGKGKLFFLLGGLLSRLFFIWALFQLRLLLSILFNFAHYFYHSQGLLLF